MKKLILTSGLCRNRLLRGLVLALVSIFLATGSGLVNAQIPELPGADLPLGRPGLGADRLPIEPRVYPRLQNISKLLRANRASLEKGPDGEPVVRARLVAIDPADEVLSEIRLQGFAIVERKKLQALGIELVVLSVPDKLSTTKALRKLRQLDPAGEYDYNHVYSSAAASTKAVNDKKPLADPAPVQAAEASPARGPDSMRIGLVDGGIYKQHPAFAQAELETWGCNARNVPSAHGTAVASLLVGLSTEVAGVPPDAQFYAADAWCGEPTGGNAVAIVSALNWLLEQDVQVVNMSLVGGANGMLERAMQNLHSKNVAVIAAVGNDGPTAKPLYPAAYDAVIAVTGVRHDRQVLPEAVRGRHVDFAARGADFLAADIDGAYVPVRGTSFATPTVSVLFARQAALGGIPDAWHQALISSATDLGRKGRDRVYGDGLLAVGPSGAVSQ